MNIASNANRNENIIKKLLKNNVEIIMILGAGNIKGDKCRLYPVNSENYNLLSYHKNKKYNIVCITNEMEYIDEKDTDIYVLLIDFNTLYFLNYIKQLSELLEYIVIDSSVNKFINWDKKFLEKLHEYIKKNIIIYMDLTYNTIFQYILDEYKNINKLILTGINNIEMNFFEKNREILHDAGFFSTPFKFENISIIVDNKNCNDKLYENNKYLIRYTTSKINYYIIIHKT